MIKLRLLLLILFSLPISASYAEGPVDGQFWHIPAASDSMADIVRFDILTFWIITPITLFVMFLLIYVSIKFRASANPVPSRVTHNTKLEIIWTVVPILILLVLAVPSFKLLTKQLTPPSEPSVTIKATGHQWYWEFEYHDASEILFEVRPIGSVEIAGSSAAAQQERVDLGKTDLHRYPRLLAVDNELIVPIDETIRVLVTAGDVIHAFAMPAFGLKLDAIPGRINELHFKPTKLGLYYGQCSELCGKYHAYMPLAIRVVSKSDYESWRSTATDDLDLAYSNLPAF